MESFDPIPLDFGVFSAGGDDDAEPPPAGRADIARMFSQAAPRNKRRRPNPLGYAAAPLGRNLHLRECGLGRVLGRSDVGAALALHFSRLAPTPRPLCPGDAIPGWRPPAPAFALQVTDVQIEPSGSLAAFCSRTHGVTVFDLDHCLVREALCFVPPPAVFSGLKQAAPASLRFLQGRPDWLVAAARGLEPAVLVNLASGRSIDIPGGTNTLDLASQAINGGACVALLTKARGTDPQFVKVWDVRTAPRTLFSFALSRGDTEARTMALPDGSGLVCLGDAAGGIAVWDLRSPRAALAKSGFERHLKRLCTVFTEAQTVTVRPSASLPGSSLRVHVAGGYDISRGSYSAGIVGSYDTLTGEADMTQAAGCDAATVCAAPISPWPMCSGPLGIEAWATGDSSLLAQVSPGPRARRVLVPLDFRPTSLAYHSRSGSILAGTAWGDVALLTPSKMDGDQKSEN